MKDLKGIKGKYYIAKLIEEGEHEHQDFKFACRRLPIMMADAFWLA